MKPNKEKIKVYSKVCDDFDSTARLAEESGEVYIFKGNRIKYKLVVLTEENAPTLTEEEIKELVTEEIFYKNKEVLERLAKT